MMTFFLFSKTHAQNSCQTATQLIVKDSLELDTFSHSGYDDRWFTFSLTDSVSHVGFQWEWASKNANVPYDSLIIYTDSCNQLIVYDVISPVLLEMEFEFIDFTNVLLQFKLADSIPVNFEFDLVFFNILECQCIPNFIMSDNEICLGDCITITNTTSICNRNDKSFSLTISPSCIINDYNTLPSVSVVAGTIQGNIGTFPNFLKENHVLEICPQVAGLHTIHVEYYGYDYEFNEYVFCETTKTFIVYEDDMNIDIEATGEPCDLNNTTLNNLPAYEVPCCTNEILFELIIDEPSYINSIYWVFHDNADFNSSNFDYYQSSWYNSLTGQGDLHEIMQSLFLHCTDTFYLSAFINGECSIDTITKAFILTEPEIDLSTTTVCFCQSTDFFLALDPDCMESWTLDFGDGYFSSGVTFQNVSHVYVSPDIYQAVLTVNYLNGLCSKTITKSVLVENIDMQIVASVNPVCVNEQVVFSIQSTCDISSSATYLWDFGDGNTSNLAAPLHEYTQAGYYTVKCKINYCGNSFNEAFNIEVLPGPDIEFVSGSNMACSPDNTWSLNLNDPEYTYSWYVWADVNGVYDIVYEETDVGETFTFDWLPDYPYGGTIQAYVYSHETQCHSVAYFEVYPCCDTMSTIEWTDELITSGGQYSDEIIVINGDVSLDGDFSFNHCLFFLAPYSSIILEDGKMSFGNSRFTNCRDTVWKEIRIENFESSITFNIDTIEYSESGIVNDVGRELEVTESKFYNNFYQSIRLSNFTNSSVNIGGNLFTCTHIGDMIFPFNNMRPEKGIYLTQNFIQNNYLEIGTSNTFSNMRSGIYCIDSDVHIFSNLFENMNILTPMYSSIAGIYAVAPQNSLFPNLIIAEQNTFENCLNGIWIQKNYNPDITLNTFSSAQNGCAIRVEQLESFNSAFVFFNTVSDYSTGIFAARNSRAIIEIFNNVIAWNQSATGGTGIRVNGNKLTTENYKIYSNDIYWPSTGIAALNLIRPQILYNTIENLRVSSPLNVRPVGIELSNCSKSYVDANQVSGSGNLPQSVVNIGIHFTASEMTTVICNVLDNLGSCIRASGLCPSSKVHTNYLYPSFEGITLSNSGQIGAQGSTFAHSGNEWHPGFLQWANGRHTFSYGSNGAASPFYVKPGSLTGIPFNPNNADQGATAINIIHTSPTTPAATACQALPPDPKESVNLDEAKLLIDELVYFPENEFESKEWSKVELIRTLPDDSLAMEDDDIQQFLLQMNSEPKGISFEVHQLAEQKEFEQARLLNLSIQTITQMEETEKQARAIQIENLETGELKEDEILQLEAIAVLCPFTHGQGVYIARSLLSLVDPNMVYSNDCEFDPNFEIRLAQASEPKSMLKVFPNPVNDILYFEILNFTNGIEATIEISDVSGRIIVSYTTTINDLNKTDVSKLQGGCYLFKVTTKNNVSFSEKICIIR